MNDVAIGESEVKTYIEDYIDLNISYSKLFLKEKNQFDDNGNKTDVIMLNDCILKKYKNDLNAILTTKTFTYEEQRKYYCNPWMLSYDLYGTVEFWFLVLDANNMSSAVEFTQDTISIYDGSLPTLIDSIIALEEEFIDTNEEEINDDNTGFAPDISDYDEDEEDDDDNIEEDE